MSDALREPDGWTDTRIERAKALWKDGYSADQISVEIGGGLSRSAVLGKIHRLGLGRGKAPTRTKAQTNSDNRLKMRIQRRAPQAVHPVQPAPKPARSKPIEVKPVRFLDRRMSDGQGNGQCSVLLNHGAPVEELMCCGLPIPEGSTFEFCAAHRDAFLIQPRKRVDPAAA